MRKTTQLAMTTLLGILLVFVVFAVQAAEKSAEQSSEQSSEQQAKPNSLNLEQMLLMPGELTQSHAHLEATCSNCHVHFDKSNQAPLCLDCHKPTKQDIDNKTGFHGRLPNAQINQCSSCHKDHLGRDANIMAFDIENFNHQQTDFELEGAHSILSCKSCHDKKHPKSDKPTFLLPEIKQCSSCHNDPHEERLGDTCTDCHNQDRWQINDFDHDKTDFSLKGKHQQLACQSCHVNEISEPLGNKCSTCHVSADSHMGVFGDKCESCHSESGWDKTDFDHLKKTEYGLEGQHQKLSCSSCHFEQQNPDTTCHGCHQQNDVHLGGNGKECEQCHNNEQWAKAEFDHDKQTPFALIGAHKALSCPACHLPGQNQPEHDSQVRQCKDCHLVDDPHKAHLGDTCQTCHAQDKWQEKVTFNHDFTGFPLTGGHGLLVCQSCHQSKDFQIDDKNCLSCHKHDDMHQGTLGQQCSDCHNSASWSSWQFDHQNQTEYALQGSHQNLTCELCHKPTMKQPLQPPTSCYGCHKIDDVHQGTYGKQCQQCHNKERFYDVQN